LSPSTAEFATSHVFVNLSEARTLANAWRLDHNETRPHSALGYQTPRQFAESLESTQLEQLTVA
jgi:transposase InsO family protein